MTDTHYPFERVVRNVEDVVDAVNFSDSQKFYARVSDTAFC